MSWREHPFEWVEGRRLGVLREFRQGPFQWFVSIVELTPRGDGGTTLTHSVRIAVKGLLGRAVANIKIGSQARRSMDEVYRRIDACLTGKLGHDPVIDPFEPPPVLARERRQRLDRWLSTLGQHGIDPTVVERVGDFLAQAPSREVARIRPLALAARLGLDADQVVAACMHGAKDGRCSCSGTSSARSAGSPRRSSRRSAPSGSTAGARHATSTTSSISPTPSR